MSLPALYTQPNSFGKDPFVPFLGQVEDVDDPKRSGRVKVRCLGLHPVEKEGEGLKTEELPWARTLMPVTHAQQNRVGGKHGLMPGSMVVGFFLDGTDANDPVVIGSFNHTAKASEENNRQQVDVGTGKIPQEVPGHTKVDVTADLNTGINTKQEKETGEDDKGDIAHDSSSLDDSTDGGSCAINKSAWSDTKKEPRTVVNSSSQNFHLEVADGLCGTLTNGRAVIANEINEMLPDGLGKFMEGSDLFDINGNIINVNAIINRLSMKISSIMKGALQSKKAEIQKFVNKKLHSTGIFAQASRSPLTAELGDMTLSIKFDVFNELIDTFIDESVDLLVTESVQSLYNQKFSSKDIGNLTGEYGSAGVSVLMDLQPIEVADAVIVDMDLAFDVTQKDAVKQSEEYVAGAETEINNFCTRLGSMSKDDYDCQDSMDEDVENQYNDIKTNVVEPLLSIPEVGDLGNFNLSNVSGILRSVLNMDFTLNPAIFNRSGLGVLSALTKDGCSPYDLYHSVNGYVGSIGGSGDKFTGGGSESGKSSKNHKDNYINVGLVGKPGVESNLDQSTSRPLTGSPRIQKIKQSLRKKILETTPEFTPVDYFEDTRVYDLRGEVEVNGRRTKYSRVLVNNQPDRSENGIYVTSNQEWTRGEDANTPSQFIRKKVVVVKSMNETEGLYYYSGSQTPRVGLSDIEFSSVQNSSEFTQEEKDAFNHLIDNQPDGSKGNFFAVSLPSSDKRAAANYVYGIPNAIVVSHPGENYFFESKDPRRSFPSIFIEKYAGTPQPVVDPRSGELVMVLVNYNSFGRDKANPSTSIFPDDSSIGISTEDPNYDVFLAGFYISNTGVGYGKDTTISVIDKDRDLETALVKPKIRNGRITRVEIINNGTGFKRIPKIVFKNTGGGKGCKLYPIMGLKPIESNPSVKQLEKNVALSISPSSTNVNLYTTIRDINE